MTEDNFLNNSFLDVFSFPGAPVSIDIMTQVKGLDFEDAFKESKVVEVEGLSIRLIGIFIYCELKNLPEGQKITTI